MSDINHNDREGIIKYHLDYQSGPALDAGELTELNAWRQVLYRLGLVGADPDRYEGLGFGNVSRRIAPFGTPPGQRRFLISGTQTGALPRLSPDHYVLVSECHPETNRVVACGPVKPSSEALTHGALYAADPQLRAVLHVHSPEIWQAAMALGLPVTDHRIAYGTPAMAAEMQRLYHAPEVRDGGVIVMGGHAEGVVSFGAGLSVAGSVMVRTLARALAVVGLNG
ncbi:MAG TPA: class II aldolase/adducin family protein [Geothermobacteraceae bacterium]|nr:class II aldolase/adducin family protein [Geothermobacteraceae bacterium]